MKKIFYFALMILIPFIISNIFSFITMYLRGMTLELGFVAGVTYLNGMYIVTGAILILLYKVSTYYAPKDVLIACATTLFIVTAVSLVEIWTAFAIYTLSPIHIFVDLYGGQGYFLAIFLGGYLCFAADALRKILKNRGSVDGGRMGDKA